PPAAPATSDNGPRFDATSTPRPPDTNTDPRPSPAAGTRHRPMPAGRTRAAGSAVAEADDELQPTPGRVDGGDLDVDQARRQAVVAHHVLGQVGPDPAGLLRPGDPQRT